MSNLLYPAFFRLDRLHLLVVGAGEVGEEKLSFILKSSPNARVTIVAPWMGRDLRELLEQYNGGGGAQVQGQIEGALVWTTEAGGQITYLPRAFHPEDVQRADLVVAATNFPEVNRAVHAAAKSARRLTNIADTPELCDFYLGSIVTRGPLKVAISTNGQSPTFAKRFRQFLEAELPEFETTNLLDNLKDFRDRLTGDFQTKVRELNELTSSLLARPTETSEELHANFVQRSDASEVRPTPSIEALNAEFEPLDFGERIRRLYEYFPVDQVLFTSSFGTKSVVMLTLVSRGNRRQKVHMLNTGYHFPETLAYKDTLSELTGLEVVEIHPEPARHQQTLDTQMWDNQPSRCCHYNKVLPLKAVKQRHTVWMSGVHSYQTMNRAAMRIFEEVEGLIHFHPLIDITEGEFLYHLEKDQLPRHPLEALGYGSIGCHHCTRPGQGRAGRWAGKEKEECGLHVS